MPPTEDDTTKLYNDMVLLINGHKIGNAFSATVHLLATVIVTMSPSLEDAETRGVEFTTEGLAKAVRAQWAIRKTGDGQKVMSTLDEKWPDAFGLYLKQGRAEGIALQECDGLTQDARDQLVRASREIWLETLGSWADWPPPDADQRAAIAAEVARLRRMLGGEDE